MNVTSWRVGVIAVVVLIVGQSIAYGLPPRSESPDPAEKGPTPAKPDLTVQI
ncbi:MAG: hypothetical protein HYY11_03465 [Candidatus Methylomirabilis oxyfera]|nr:hypothetical protein [Candidatus Methylomirabilis oxyfera]